MLKTRRQVLFLGMLSRTRHVCGKSYYRVVTINSGVPPSGVSRLLEGLVRWDHKAAASDLARRDARDEPTLHLFNGALISCVFSVGYASYSLLHISALTDISVVKVHTRYQTKTGAYLSKAGAGLTFSCSTQS